MKKELIIIVYRICVEGFTRQQAEEQICDLMKLYRLSDDEELKENYIIREIWLPILKGDSDVKIIYPTSLNKSVELDKLIEEINAVIKENPSERFKKDWEKLMRELKLRKIGNI